MIDGLTVRWLRAIGQARKPERAEGSELAECRCCQTATAASHHAEPHSVGAYVHTTLSCVVIFTAAVAT